MYRRIEKVAEDSSGVTLLGKTIVATTCSCQRVMAGCLKKVVSGPFERDTGISDYAQSVIQDHIYKLSTKTTNATPILGCSITKNKRTVSDVLQQIKTKTAFKVTILV